MAVGSVSNVAIDRDGTFVVDVELRDIENAGAFQFELTYDPDILAVEDDGTGRPLIEQGPFLGSTGREVVCREAEAQEGSVGLTCVTLRLEPAGPNGDGTIARVTFRALDRGTSDLKFTSAQVNQPDATVIALVAEDATLVVE